MAPGGRPKSDQGFHSANVRFPLDLWLRVEAKAAFEQVTVSFYVRQVLEMATSDVEIPEPAEVVVEVPLPATPHPEDIPQLVAEGIEKFAARNVPRESDPQPEVETPVPESDPVHEVTRCKTPSGVHPSSRRVGSVCMVCHEDVGSAL